jgi:NADPH2:quinone reductase
MSMKAIRIHEFGGPEVLKYEDCPDMVPGAGQVVINIQAVGVNYTDIYTRSGNNRQLGLPATPGVEGAGVVAAVGDGVTEVGVGDAVAYWGVIGSYAEQGVAPAQRVVKMPEGMDAKTAAAVLLQGMTAHYLAYTTYPLKAGDSALVHAGAGGTGLLLIQMAKRAGARVFATVSTDEKAELAREAGADHAIIYTREDFEEEVMKATDGQGIQVAYDSVGLTTLEKSRRCLARRGYLVLYGQSSGAVPPATLGELVNGGVFFTRPGLGDYTATREELLQRAGEVFNWANSGELKVRIDRTLPLSDASAAHSALQSRGTAGKLLLVP